MKYKALSVVAPWGQRIAEGIKTIEVRSWTTPELGPQDDLLIVENSQYLMNDGETDPNGLAVALVKIREMRDFRPEDMTASCASRYEDGWFSWILHDVRPIRKEIPVFAARKIYELEIQDSLF